MPFSKRANALAKRMSNSKGRLFGS